MFVVMATTYRN